MFTTPSTLGSARMRDTVPYVVARDFKTSKHRGVPPKLQAEYGTGCPRTGNIMENLEKWQKKFQVWKNHGISFFKWKSWKNHGIPLQVCINRVINAAKWLEWQMFYMQESLLSEQAIKTVSVNILLLEDSTAWYYKVNYFCIITCILLQ